jgi:ribose transport system ATP-binding protein
MAPGTALSLRGVSKHFAGAAALSDVSLDLWPGEVLGLVGENGAGKSTLVKIITGVHAPDAGARGEAWGRPFSFPVSSHRELGVAVIHQDLGLVDTMTVVENLGISVGYGTGGMRFVNWRAERARCVAELEGFGMSLDPDALVGELDPAERAMVAMVRGARELKRVQSEGGTDTGSIFILDEPTAYLTHAEAERLLALIRSVADTGACVIFISHHLREVTRMSDRIVVMRDGRIVKTLDDADVTPIQLASHMLGRELDAFYPSKHVPSADDVLLDVAGLTGETVDDISFQVQRGEVLGVTGLAGMGQQELPYLLAGAARVHAGTVRRGDGTAVGDTPSQARRAGVVLVPGNRKRDGVWPAGTASENVSLPILGQYFVRGRLGHRRERRESRTVMERFGVVPADERMLAAEFSGGNQQKIVLAKWLRDRPDVLLLDEPTQGVDAAARRDILRQVVDVARAGSAVAVFSSDLEQLASICTRVLVMSRGRVVASLRGDELSEDNLLLASQG